MELILLICAFPFLAIGLGLSVRPFPLRVDATDRAERVGQHCLRISFLLLAIAAVMVGIISVLVIGGFSGGHGLLEYKGRLLFGGKIWEFASAAGILSGIGASFHRKWRINGYKFITAHAMLLFIAILFACCMELPPLGD